MIWHIVRLDLGSLSEEVRQDVEEQLAGLSSIDAALFVRTSRDLKDPDITGLLVGVADEAALTAYLEHPDHQPVIRLIRELDVPRVALDIVSDDDPTTIVTA